MPYLGRQLTSGNYLKLDDISSQFNGSKTTFNLKSGGNVFTPGSSYSLLVSLGGIIQEAESAYTIDRDTITFASAPPTGHDAFIIILGLALGVGVPADGSVGLEHLQDTAKGVGISSSGTVVGSAITSLNFVGAGNTFSVTNGVAEISISSGAGGTFASNSVGVHTTKIVGVNTNAIAGAATSEGAMQVTGNLAIAEGMLITDSNIDTSLNIPSGKNGLFIGPVTIGAGVTIDVAANSTLVVV